MTPQKFGGTSTTFYFPSNNLSAPLDLVVLSNLCDCLEPQPPEIATPNTTDKLPASHRRKLTDCAPNRIALATSRKVPRRHRGTGPTERSWHACARTRTIGPNWRPSDPSGRRWSRWPTRTRTPVREYGRLELACRRPEGLVLVLLFLLLLLLLRDPRQSH